MRVALPASVSARSFLSYEKRFEMWINLFMAVSDRSDVILCGGQGVKIQLLTNFQ